jgi:hypothetical protein
MEARTCNRRVDGSVSMSDMSHHRICAVDMQRAGCVLTWHQQVVQQLCHHQRLEIRQNRRIQFV